MLIELIKIADWLDKEGFKKEADKLDNVLVSLADAGLPMNQRRKKYWAVQDGRFRLEGNIA